MFHKSFISSPSILSYLNKRELNLTGAIEMSSPTKNTQKLKPKARQRQGASGPTKTNSGPSASEPIEDGNIIYN